MYVFIHFTNSVLSLYFLWILQVHAFQKAYLYKEFYKTFAADNSAQPDTTSFLTSEKNCSGSRSAEIGGRKGRGGFLRIYTNCQQVKLFMTKFPFNRGLGYLKHLPPV